MIEKEEEPFVGFTVDDKTRSSLSMSQVHEAIVAEERKELGIVFLPFGTDYEDEEGKPTGTTILNSFEFIMLNFSYY